MKEAIEKVIRALVGSPDLVEVYEQGDGKNVRFRVRVSPDDYGRLIGREGRTIKAIRSLLYVSGQKHGRRYHLDLEED
ncbi:MAG: KH domain-containing protein [Pyrinomonadaceae bacterium]